MLFRFMRRNNVLESWVPWRFGLKNLGSQAVSFSSEGLVDTAGLLRSIRSCELLMDLLLNQRILLRDVHVKHKGAWELKQFEQLIGCQNYSSLPKVTLLFEHGHDA